MAREQLELAIRDRTGAPARLAASYATPAAGTDRPVLVCLPGGTYTGAYFDLHPPGHDGYSFVDAALDRGFPVLTLDHLGTGSSSRPEHDIDLDDQAAAITSALDLVPSLIGRSGPYVAVGHSMGGYITMLQQADAAPYAAVAILGTTNQHVATLGLAPEAIDAAASRAGREAMVDQLLAVMPERYLEPDRSPMATWFHLPDVPADVVAHDDATTSTCVPRGCAAASSVPGVTVEAASAIECPVFLGFGEVDVSPAPHAEPGAYTRSGDVTLYVLEGSAHCHNLASTRHRLWDRLLTWCADVATPAR